MGTIQFKIIIDCVIKIILKAETRIKEYDRRP